MEVFLHPQACQNIQFFFSSSWKMCHSAVTLEVRCHHSYLFSHTASHYSTDHSDILIKTGMTTDNGKFEYSQQQTLMHFSKGHYFWVDILCKILLFRKFSYLSINPIPADQSIAASMSDGWQLFIDFGWSLAALLGQFGVSEWSQGQGSLLRHSTTPRKASGCPLVGTGQVRSADNHSYILNSQ